MANQGKSTDLCRAQSTVTINCPSFVVARALARLDAFYRLWERDRNSKVPALRGLAIAAKAYGLVLHDQTLDCSQTEKDARF